MANRGARPQSALFVARIKVRVRQAGSIRKLAPTLGCHHSYLAKVINGDVPVSRKFAAQCDAALEANGELLRAWLVDASGAVSPAELPPVGSLAGRAGELEFLEERASPPGRGRPRVSLIDGPAGVGKSALALKLAHRQTIAYLDGQLYVDLRGVTSDDCEPLDPEVALGWFCKTLGVRDIPPGLERRSALFRSLVQDRRVLVVLDNAASIEQVEPLLPASGDCWVIVTSRRSLGRLRMVYGGDRLTLEPLATADSVALLTALIGTQRAAAELESLHEVAHLCGHLPVALRIAGEAIALDMTASIADMAEDLRRNLLDALETEDVSIRKVLRASVRLLSADASKQLKALGIVEWSRISKSGAAAVAGLAPLQARRSQRELSTLNLVATQSDHLSSHQLVLEYARELAEEHETREERVTAVRRFVAWYASMLAAAESALFPELDHRSIPLPMLNGGETPPIIETRDAAAWCEDHLHRFGDVVATAARYEVPVEVWLKESVRALRMRLS